MALVALFPRAGVADPRVRAALAAAATSAGVTVDTLLARKHREHHADPRDVPLVFIPWQTLIVGHRRLPRPCPAGVPADRPGADASCSRWRSLGLLYEWTHYLIHSDYKPRTRPYRAVWRNHRLHHYKNEHYWFTVTSTRTADRLFGTYPDPATVETSPTAKNLHGAG